MFNKRLVIVVAALILISLVGGLYALGRQTMENQDQPTNSQNQPSTSNNQTTPPSTATTEIVEGAVDPFLGNLEILSSQYSDREYFFINQTVMEFANSRLSKGGGLEIDPVSFGHRSDGTYGFSVRETSTGEALFYVVITKLPSGELRVEEFL